MPTLASSQFKARQHDKSDFERDAKLEDLFKKQRGLDLTSGQHSPLFDKLVPFEQWPEKIEGPQTWVREDYENNPERWQYNLTEADVADLSRAADAYLSAGKSLTEMAKEAFQLGPHLTKLLAVMKDDLINGKGFSLMKGHPSPVTHPDWPVEKIAVSYMGMGSHLGDFVSQNGKGHILGHVKDLGNDPTAIDRVRIYSTNARQFFHRDGCDIIGLCCLHQALEGGESDIVSTAHVYNCIRKERPDLIKVLSEPIWYFDRKGEINSEGNQLPYLRCSIFYYFEKHLIAEWDPYFVRSLTRFWKSGELPALTPEQEEAMQVLEATAQREALHMVLEPGWVQWVSGRHLLHARTAYVDHPPPKPKRQLMRLWLAVSEDNGGWPVPFADSNHKRRGGIQVNFQPHTSPLDGE